MNDAETIYEPRAFWDVQAVTPVASPVAAETIVAFNKENLRNGTRNPITLTKMLLAPVGYTLLEYAGSVTPPATAADYDNSATVMQKCRVFLTSPGRQNFMMRPLRLPCFGSLPIDDVSMRGSAFDYASGLHGVTKWVFDRPMIIPRGGIAEFQLGAPVAQPVDFVAAAGEFPYFTIAFSEENGLVGGNVRSHADSLLYYGASTPPRAAAYPYAVNNDALGVSPGNVVPVYPQTHYFTRDIWRAQEATLAGSTIVKGFSVTIDQSGYDDRLQTSAIANVPGSPVAPLSLRTPVGRAQLTGCGSGAEWWRPDIPLALLGATLGAAQCFELAEPITLHPGDVLEAELRVPGAAVLTGGQGPVTITPTYQIGISFLGMSAIEG